MDMPAYPSELSNSIPEKVWDSRVDKLQAALARAWHWTEKAFFSFAFVMSVVMPWPIVALISRYMGKDGSNRVGSDKSIMSASSEASSAVYAATRALAGIAPSIAPSAFGGVAPLLAANQALPSARAAVSVAVPTLNPMLRARQLPASMPLLSSSAWTDFYGNDSSYAGDGYWQDNFTDNMRWAAILSLFALLVAVWTPWTILSIRNKRRLDMLVKEWNETDTKLGATRNLRWALEKGPAFANAKLLTVCLPHAAQQRPSSFHPHAYPPCYGSAGRGFGASTPSNDDPRMDTFLVVASGGPAVDDDKKDWIEPPTMHAFPVESTADRFHELPSGVSPHNYNSNRGGQIQPESPMCRRDSIDSHATMRTAPLNIRPKSTEGISGRGSVFVEDDVEGVNANSRVSDIV